MGNSSSSISPLRQRMIDDMTMHRLGAKTQSAYLRHVVELNNYLGHSPHKATAEDLRRYQLHLVQSGKAVHPPAVSMRDYQDYDFSSKSLWMIQTD